MDTVAANTYLIDVGFLREGVAASYLLVDGGRAAFVETGTARSVPALLTALARANLDVGDVDLVAVTHVHLDHAAGAGALLAELPNARLVVHPRGARHMADPTQLIAGASAVQGEQFVHATYGAVVPVASDRIVEAPEGTTAHFGGRELRFWDTPGHARHHICVVDEGSGGVFTGDVFGLAYRNLDSDRGPFIFPTTSPVQFDPVAMHASIDRIVAAEPECVMLTHFGRVDKVAQLADHLHALIDESVHIATSEPSHQQIVDRLMSMLLARARTHGCPHDEHDWRATFAMDVELNAQGLVVWHQRDLEKSNKTTC